MVPIKENSITWRFVRGINTTDPSGVSRKYDIRFNAVNTYDEENTCFNNQIVYQIIGHISEWKLFDISNAGVHGETIV